MIPSTCSPRLQAVFAVAAIATIVKAGNVAERQNPGFITTLPTEATNTTAAVTRITGTATAASTPSPFSTTSNPFLQTASAPIPTVPLSSSTPTAVIGALQGPFFGGVPEINLDVPLTSAFLMLFFLGVIINVIFYRSKLGPSKQTTTDVVSGLAGLFCLTRVLSCILRDAWAVAATSTGVVFLALVSENAGTAFLFILNFYLAKRMTALFNIRMSLWAKTVIESCAKKGFIVYVAVVFLLNTLGVALLEFQPQEQNGASTAVNLVRASAGLFLVVGMALLGTVLFVKTSAECPNTRRLTVSTVVFFMGAGVFTMTSQLVRVASSFYIWKNDNDINSQIILSKPVYYITGMGFEILIIAFYTSTRIDLLFASIILSWTVAHELCGHQRQQISELANDRA